MSQKPAPLANLFTSAERSKVIQATGQFPDIPSIRYKYDAVGAAKSQQCSEWFTEFLSRTDKDGNKINLPGIETAAGEYLTANGDKILQDDRMTDIVSHICEHDLKSRQIITRVGDIVRRLLDRALIIPSLLAENARLCECKPECGPSEPPKPECDAATVAKCCPEDLADDRKLLVEQLSYMALQLKSMTQQLGFVYDPATQSFYNESDDMYKDAGSGLKADKTIDDSSVHMMLGLQTDQIRELWDVLSSAQNNLVYGTLVDLYPEHPSCKDPTVMTSEPLYNISITYDDGSGGPAVPTDAAKQKLVWLRLYLKRLDTIVGNAALSSEVAGITDAQLQKAVDEYVAIVPGSYKLTFRVPADWFGTLLKESSRRLIGIREGDEMVKGPSVGQTALTSIAVRKPNQREMKSIEKLCDSQAFKEVYNIAGTKNTSAFLTFDELKSKVIGVPDPEPVNCQGSWADEGDCSEPCGDGLQKEKYTVGTSAENGGQECEAADGETRSKACNKGECAPPPPPEPKPEPEPAKDAKQEDHEKALAKLAALIDSRMVNFYARVRPWLGPKMDWGATVAQAMQAGSHLDEAGRDANKVRMAASKAAENILGNFDAQFPKGDALLNPHTRMVVGSRQCMNFAGIFGNQEYLQTWHGHELKPGAANPTGLDATVGFNYVYNDQDRFDDTSQATIDETIAKNNSKFMEVAWENIRIFFGDPTQSPPRQPQNVVYVAYGASGSGKTTTSAAILSKLLSRFEPSKYSLICVSDYLNRCFDMFCDAANTTYDALKSPRKATPGKELPQAKTSLGDMKQDALVHNKLTGETFYNAHALDDVGVTDAGLKSYLEGLCKDIAKQMGISQDPKIEGDRMRRALGKKLFREGNDRFAVGYGADKESPTKGIKVPRDSNGMVNTAEFLAQFAQLPLTQAMAESQADKQTDSAEQAEYLWKWLEQRVNIFRRRGNTGLNKTSSRSHVLYIIVDNEKLREGPNVPGSLFVLGDCAGTEDLRFLVPLKTQKAAAAKGLEWYSAALPTTHNETNLEGALRSAGCVDVAMDTKWNREDPRSHAHVMYPADTIIRLAEATFKQSAGELAKASGKTVEALWKEREMALFNAKKVMAKLPPLQQESQQITESLLQFQKFLKQHKAKVDAKSQDMVDCEQFVIMHHKAVKLPGKETVGFKLVKEPALFVQKLLCPLITPESSVVVLAAFAPRASDDANNNNTARFVSSCGCDASGEMACAV